MTLGARSAPAAHAEATDLIRKPIDRIVLTPIEDEKGRKTLSIDLHGHLTGILSLATKAKKPLDESGFPVVNAPDLGRLALPRASRIPAETCRGL